MSEIIKEIDKYDNILDQFEQHNGIPPKIILEATKEIQEYLNMPIDILSKLTPEKCSYISCRLSQFAYHLQKLYNIEKARKTLITSELKRLCIKEMENYTGSWEQKEIKVINENSAVKHVYDTNIKIQQRIDRINYLATQVNTLADRYMSIQIVKGKENDR